MTTNRFVSSSFWGKYFQYEDSFKLYAHRSYILLVFLVVISIVHGSVFSSKLPDEMACHFSFSGEADGNCSKV